MAQSNKPVKSAKVTPAQRIKLGAAISTIETHYANVLASWGEATPEQRQAFLGNSPLLTEIINWSARWQQ